MGEKMMSNVQNGRFAATAGKSFVVFYIGMRINKWWAIHKWLPVFLAMGKMLKELYQHPELGFMGAEYCWNGRTIGLIQYWNSYEQLETYSHGGYHLEAWKAFQRQIGSDGSVGIFHETYNMEPAKYEAIYANMPLFGLAKAIGQVPATGRYQSSRKRLTAHPPEEKIE